MTPNRAIRPAGVLILALAWTALQSGCQQGSAPQPAAKPADPSAKPAAQQSAEETAKKETEIGPPEEPNKAPAEEPAKKPDKEPAKSPETPAAAKPAKVPLGLPPLPVPEDNPMTTEKIELGKMLYFDGRLSKDGKISCATCHNPKEAWAEHEPTSTGIGSQKGGRNSPTVVNAAYATVQFWDGRAPSLEAQALGPIENPIEMGHKLDAMIQDLSKLDDYKGRFQKVFGAEITKEGVAKAIAAFERTVLSGNSPYDRYVAGDKAALDEAQKRGLELFENSGCATCHAPPLFSNYRYFNAGVGMDKEKPDPGRMEVTKEPGDLGKFRVSALREVANTAPYFHDGSVEKLEDAVALMAGGGKDNLNLAVMLKAVRNAKLKEKDQKDLVEFLKALSGEYPIVDPPKLP